MLLKWPIGLEWTTAESLVEHIRQHKKTGCLCRNGAPKEKVATKEVTKTKAQNQDEPIVPPDVQVEFEKYLRHNECIDSIIVS